LCYHARMNSRERVLTAAARGQPDHIPIDFWAVDEVYGRLAAEWGVESREEVLGRCGADIRYVRGPGGGASEPDEGGVTVDHWGVRRRRQTVTGVRSDGTPYAWKYEHLAGSPLAEASSLPDIEGHAWPDPGRWDYSGVADACRAFRDAGFAVAFGGDRLDRTAQLKAGMYLRGPERFVVDLLEEPALAECILEHIASYYLEYNRRVFEAARGLIDLFFMGDDMGTQHSTWVSVELYRNLFKGRFTRFNELAHRYGARTMYHTCGRVTGLIREFVEGGLDILQSLQPGAMREDFAAIKREYGRDLCFQGGIDIQEVLPSGRPEDVRAHVREVAHILGRGGGYIFGTAHNILPDAPTGNILALLDAYR